MLSTINTHRSSIIKACLYNFCNSKSTSTFPYIFNSQKKYPYNQKIQQASIYNMETIFGRQINRNFIESYKTYLEALQANDIQFLKGIAAKQLFQNWKAINTQLKNKDANINVRFGKISYILGVEFDRDKHDYQAMSRSSSAQNTHPYFLYYFNKNPNIDMSNYPLMYVVQIFFQSKMKLCPIQNQESKKQNSQKKELSILSQQQKGAHKNKEKPSGVTKQQQNRSEVHMLQFEYIKQFNFWQFSSFVIKERIKNLFNTNKFYQLIINKAFEGGQWKIGDVDGILGGNFSKLKKK